MVFSSLALQAEEQDQIQARQTVEVEVLAFRAAGLYHYLDLPKLKDSLQQTIDTFISWISVGFYMQEKMPSPEYQWPKIKGLLSIDI